MLLLRFCQIFVAFVYDVKYYTNTCIHSSFMFIYENLNTGLDEFGWILASKRTRQLHQIHLFSIFFLSFLILHVADEGIHFGGTIFGNSQAVDFASLSATGVAFATCPYLRNQCPCGPVNCRSLCLSDLGWKAFKVKGKTTGSTQIAKKLDILNLSVRFIDDHSIIHVNLWWNFLNASQNKIRSHATWHLCNKNDIHEYHNGICHYMLRAIMCCIEVMIQWYNLIKGLTWTLPFFPGDSFKQKKSFQSLQTSLECPSLQRLLVEVLRPDSFAAVLCNSSSSSSCARHRRAQAAQLANQEIGRKNVTNF